jgi:hypothetical protein
MIEYVVGFASPRSTPVGCLGAQYSMCRRRSVYDVMRVSWAWVDVALDLTARPDERERRVAEPADVGAFGVAIGEGHDDLLNEGGARRRRRWSD